MINALPQRISAAPLSVVAPTESPIIPHIGTRGQQGFARFKSAYEHKAFAIAPGGAWAWAADEIDIQTASDEALSSCAQSTAQQCVLYAVNGDIVFDGQAWPTLWGPYYSKEEAANLAVGTKRAMRFPNLKFNYTKGDKRLNLTDFKGDIVILHFWASWCRHCLRELPALASLYTKLGNGSAGVKLLTTQVRENITTTKNWLSQHAIDIPLYDSGTVDTRDHSLRLANGNKIDDRSIAPAFPATYVLDRNGVVLFSHAGALDWQEYENFIRHAVAN